MKPDPESRSAYQTGTIREVSTQIAVRLPDEIVAFIDDEIRGQHARSRAAVVVRALERERRRRLAERDAEILAASMSASSDWDALAGHAARTSLDID
ncbi:YlcI/YnfO family protein [Mycobacterium sp.]|uniref:YlcI/YnfO family protein n=1 Tax=Mycobacterium sp. TaxID=1785 RepID=UPI0012813647|nr:YlcI/YnfO family protein [Mycobacterium sp.]KAA8939230.1 MAG: antitoxin [Mycobacterium sp.]